MASLIVSASAPPSMQIMPLREDGLFLKILGPKIIVPTTMLLHDQKAKKNVQIRECFVTISYLKAVAIDNYD